MKKPQSHVERGIIALICLTSFYALLSVLARYLSTDFTILQQVYLRVVVAMFLAAIVFHRYIRWKHVLAMPRREWMLLAFRGFAGYVVGVSLISKAATETLIGNVSFIGALPFVPLLGFLFFKEKLTWWKITFIVSALSGVTLLSLRDPQNLLSWGGGEIYAIVATFGFALSFVTRRWHTSYLNNQEITALIFVFGAVQTFVLSALFGEGMPNLQISALSWLVIALGGILNVIALFLSNYAFEHVDAVRAGNLLNLESAWGLLFGLLFYSEWPTPVGLVGGLIIVASVIGMNWFSRRSSSST